MATTTSPHPTQTEPPAPPRWRLNGLPAVLLVALAAAVAQSFGRFTIGAVLPAIRGDLDLSNTVAGSLATANVGAYLLGTLLLATVASRFRLLAVMRVGVSLVVAGLLLAAVSTGPVTLAGAMVIMGLGGALTWIPAPMVATAALAPERRGRAISMLSSGMGIGIVFSSQLARVIRADQGDEGWQQVYLVLGLIGAAVMAGVWLLLTHRQPRPSGNSGLGGFGVLRTMRGWLPYTIAYTAFGFMYLLVMAFLTTKLEDDDGWTSSEASLAFTVLGIAIIFGGPLFVALTERTSARFALTVAFALWTISTTVLLAGRTVPGLIAAAVAGLLFAAIPTMLTVYVVNNTTSDDYGPTFAAATFAFGVAQMISPQFGGWLADVSGSFTPVFLLSIGLAVIGLVAVLNLPDRAVDSPG